MKFKLKNKDVKVYFDHRIEDVNVNGELLPRKVTTCKVIFDNDEENTLEGYSIVHPLDNFSKEKGRQISLTEAISELSKEERKVFWDNYRKWGKDRF